MAKTREVGCPGPYAACVNPGDGEGFGTEVGPDIGCGGLFISRSFISPH